MRRLSSDARGARCQGCCRCEMTGTGHSASSHSWNVHTSARAENVRVPAPGARERSGYRVMRDPEKAARSVRMPREASETRRRSQLGKDSRPNLLSILLSRPEVDYTCRRPPRQVSNGEGPGDGGRLGATTHPAANHSGRPCCNHASRTTTRTAISTTILHDPASFDRGGGALLPQARRTGDRYTA